MRILSIAQDRFARQWQDKFFRKIFSGLGAQIVGDDTIIASSILEGNSSEPPASSKTDLTQLVPFLHHWCIILWAHQYYHILEIFSRGANERYAANIDLL